MTDADLGSPRSDVPMRDAVRRDMKAGAHAEAKASPDSVREWMLSDEVMVPWRAQLKKRLDAGKRDAIRLVAEALGIVGAQQALAINVLVAVGAENEHDARRRIEMTKRVEHYTEDDRFALAWEYCESYLASRGEKLIRAKTVELNGGEHG